MIAAENRTMIYQSVYGQKIASSSPLGNLLYSPYNWQRYCTRGDLTENNFLKRTEATGNFT
jgi:hypothetical protein